MRKIDIFLVTAVAALLAGVILIFGQSQAFEARKLFLFYSPNCHFCSEAKAKLIPYIERKFRGEVIVEYRDLSDVENYKLMLGLQDKYQAKAENIPPIFFMEGRFLSGAQSVKTFTKFISESLSGQAEKDAGYWPTVDLSVYFKSFAPAAVISAGLIDGINPCAFTVIVFFISFLALQGYKRKELLIIGLTFVSAVFLTYVFIGLGIFAFLYRLEGFAFVSRAVNISIGALSIILGGCAVYDIIKFKKTKDTQGLILQLPQAIKNRIHYVVGAYYRRRNKEQGADKRGILTLALSALITGFLVSLLEAVCTGQTYLPTITFVLRVPELKARALSYLLIYNLMFVIPLLTVFCLALLGATSEQFSAFLKKHLLSVKILIAAVFFALGSALLYSYLPKPAPIYEKSAPLYEGEKSISILEPEKSALLSGTAAKESRSWDFGSVREGDIVKHAFIFKNGSKKVVTIKEVTTSCGCAVSEAGQKVLQPEEDTLIDVQFDSKGYSGEVRQYVYVYSDDTDNPVVKFTIKALVIK